MNRLSANPADVDDYTDGRAFGLDDGWWGISKPGVFAGVSPEWVRGYNDGYEQGNAQYRKDYPDAR
jgi:hypothetical protein